MAGIEDVGGASLSSFDAALKDYYLPEIRTQFNSDTVTWYRLLKTSEPIVGRDVVLSLNTSRSEGYGAVASGGRLPDAHSQGYTKATFPWKRQYGRIKIPGELIAASRSDAGAFANALDAEINGMVRDFKNDCNGQLFNDGSGRLGVITSITGGGGSADDTILVRHPFDTASQGGAPSRIRPGMYVGILDVSECVDVNTPAWTDLDTGGFRHFYVNSVNRATGAVVLRHPDTTTKVQFTNTSITDAAVAAGDVLCRCHIREPGTAITGYYSDLDSSFTPFTGLRTSTTTAASDGMKEIMGLFGAVNDGDVFTGYAASAVTASHDLQGVDYATGDWAAYVNSNGNTARSVSELLLQTCQDEMEIRGNAELTIIITSYAGRRAYEQTLYDNKRFVNTLKLEGGFTAVSFNDKPLVPEKDCPDGNYLLLDESSLGFARLSDLFWLDKDGAILHRLQDYDAYQATLALYGQLFVTRRNANALLADITM